MAITLKSDSEIQLMDKAGSFAAAVLKLLEDKVKPGVTTDELNTIAHQHITQVQKSIPATLNYHGYPKSICTSINHVVCHGIPNDKPLKEGDIVNIDVTVITDGFHGDTSAMFVVGAPSAKARRVCKIAHDCLYKAIDLVKPGVPLNQIGYVIEKYATSQNCSVVRDYCGHGLGKHFHEEPQVLHYFDKINKTILEEGMTFTIEPMINLGKAATKTLADGWAVVTRDKSLSAQWEHSLAVVKDGVKILTENNLDNSFLTN